MHLFREVYLLEYSGLDICHIERHGYIHIYRIPDQQDDRHICAAFNRVAGIPFTNAASGNVNDILYSGRRNAILPLYNFLQTGKK
jgi:hypothetical protein